jgi:hypothetical protein
MAARVIETADAVAAAIRTAWAPIAPDAATSDYGAEVILDDDDPDVLTGRKVFVFATEYAAPEFVDGASLRRTYGVGIVIVERYAAAAGTPPKAWMDARVLFVEQSIYRLLRNPDLVLSNTLVPSPEAPGTVDVVYDLDLYLQRKTFWSVCTFTFQEAD